LDSFNISTRQHSEFIDITDQVQQKITDAGVRNGLAVVFIPHTTAGITINENADPDVRRDILYELNKIIPLDDHYHHTEGNAAAHIKASLMGSSVTVIVENGQLKLGTWQGIYFCEFDGPRSRKVWVNIIGI
jgi:secondary thiamine-phosphate synthase enzyme